MDTNLEKLELHYFFDELDKSHTMNAVVRNRCEHELLQLVGVISQEFHIQIQVETEPAKDGGYIDFYKFMASAEGTILTNASTFLLGLLTLILSRVPLRKSKLDKEEQKLSIEEKKLGIEEKKLNILKLQQELEQKEIKVEPITIEKVEYIVNYNIKIIKRTSNFYNLLEKYKKVEKISFTKVDDGNKPVDEPVFVGRGDFGKFILESDNLEPVTDEEATIEIISPVLKPGKYKWKGLYTKVENSIEFAMTDKEFKKNIINDGVTFKSGTTMKCILEISKKIDDLGNIYNSDYKVITVLSHSDGLRMIETPKGKKIRHAKEDPRQIDLFSEESKSINFPNSGDDDAPF